MSNNPKQSNPPWEHEQLGDILAAFEEQEEAIGSYKEQLALIHPSLPRQSIFQARLATMRNELELLGAMFRALQ